MKKVMIFVAPVSHTVKGSRLRPDDVAHEVIECAHVGATMVHLHVRDEMGNQCFDLTHFTKTLDIIRAESDILIQGSTGGLSDLSLEDRCVSVTEPRVQTASLNMGSTNFGEDVYINTIPDIRFWAEQIDKNGVIPEFEVFEPGMIHSVTELEKEGCFLKKPWLFNIALGFPGALPATAEALSCMVRFIPEGALWGLSVHGMTDLHLHAMALGLGADFVRVGFEVGVSVSGGHFDENVHQVEALAQLIRLSGNEVASLSDAKKILGINK